MRAEEEEETNASGNLHRNSPEDGGGGAVTTSAITGINATPHITRSNAAPLNERLVLAALLNRTSIHEIKEMKEAFLCESVSKCKIDNLLFVNVVPVNPQQKFLKTQFISFVDKEAIEGLGFRCSSILTMNDETPTASTSTGSLTFSNAMLSPVAAFWPTDPVVWFAQVEAQFLTRNITSQVTKYAYVVASLQPEIAQEVRDLLVNPPTAEPYDQLKAELIKRT
eukprot:gene12572-biopygen2832